MNSKLYKLIFCQRLKCLIAVSEFTRSYGRSFLTAGHKICVNAFVSSNGWSYLALITGLALGTLPSLVLAVPALPGNGQVVVGQGKMKIKDQTLSINQQTDKLAINWGNFDIAQGNSVIFSQPGQQSIALNRVIGQSVSHIFGHLQANGQVFLLNPNGVLFGKGAQINVGGLVASTQSFSDKEFLAGRYTLSSQGSEGEIINQANLQATTEGYIALVGKRVKNQGTITTQQGKTVLAVGDIVTLNLDKNQLLGVVVNKQAVSVLIENSGLIQADGGVIQLTAKGKNMLMDTVINNTGILQAQGIKEKNGIIRLDGGDSGVVKQAGTLDGQNPQGKGAWITIEGKRIHLSSDSKIDAGGRNDGGTVLIGGGWQGRDKRVKNAKAVVMSKDAVIDVSAAQNGKGGTVVLWSDNYTHFQGNIRARGGGQSGDGGQVETSSKDNLQAFGNVDVGVNKGLAGEWLLDPAEVSIVNKRAESNIVKGSNDSERTFTPIATQAQILNTTINNELNKGGRISITTHNPKVSACQQCNITVNADITKATGTDSTLTLYSNSSIIINSNITSDTSKLHLFLMVGYNGADSSIKFNNSTISLNGGNLSVGGSHQVNPSRINLQGGQYNVNDMSLMGNSIIASQEGVNISAANISATGQIILSGTSKNSEKKGWNGLKITRNSTITSVGSIYINANSNSEAAWIGGVHASNISSQKAIYINVTGSGQGGFSIENSNITSKIGNIIIDVNGTITTDNNQGLLLKNSKISGSSIAFNGNVTGGNTLVIDNANITATGGDIKVNVTGSHQAFWLNKRGNMKAAKDITLNAISSSGDGIKINGSPDGWINILAAGNITAQVFSKNKKPTIKTLLLNNVNLTSVNRNIDMRGRSVENGNVDINNISLNASTGNITFSSENTSNSASLSLAGNVSMAAKNGKLTGKTRNADTGSGITFRPGAVLSIAGNFSLIGETNGNKEPASGINFNGINVINIPHKSKLKLLGENKGIRTGEYINGIANSTGENNTLTINNNGSIKIEGHAINGNGVYFHDGDNTLVLNGTGDALIKGESFKANGVFLTGFITHGSGVTRVEGDSHDAKGVYLDGAQQKISSVTVVGNSTKVTGVHLRGNAMITNTSLIGQSEIGSGVKVEGSLILDNATLNGATTDGRGVEIAGNVNGINVSLVMGVTTGNGHGVDIAANQTVVGTSEADLLMINGTATVGDGIGVKLYGNNDLSNTSLRGKSIDGIALDLIGPLTNSGTIMLNGNASGRGNGVHLNGEITGGIVHGSSTQGNGLLMEGETVLDNTTLRGQSINGKGLVITGNLSGSNDSAVNGVSTGTGISIEVMKDVDLKGASERDLLSIAGTATDDAGNGIQLNGNNTLNNTTLTGYSIDGTALKLIGILTNHRNNTVSGHATGKGRGVHLNGTINAGMISGSSLNGSGAVVDGDSALDNATLTGHSTQGDGVTLRGRLTGSNGSTISGCSRANGSGVAIAQDAVLRGENEQDLLAIHGEADGEWGTGVKLVGNSTLFNTSLNQKRTHDKLLALPSMHQRNARLKDTIRRDAIRDWSAGSSVKWGGNNTFNHASLSQDTIKDMEVADPLTNQGSTILNGHVCADGTEIHLNNAIEDAATNGQDELLKVSDTEDLKKINDHKIIDSSKIINFSIERDKIVSALAGDMTAPYVTKEILVESGHKIKIDVCTNKELLDKNCDSYWLNSPLSTYTLKDQK